MNNILISLPYSSDPPPPPPLMHIYKLSVFIMHLLQYFGLKYMFIYISRYSRIPRLFQYLNDLRIQLKEYIFLNFIKHLNIPRNLLFEIHFKVWHLIFTFEFMAMQKNTLCLIFWKSRKNEEFFLLCSAVKSYYTKSY